MKTKKQAQTEKNKEKVMRVTNSMMVHNMVYWSSKQLERLNNASTVSASGKQLNKPSDDPTATRQILEDRATISSYTQYEYNLEVAKTWISVSDTTLSSVYSLLGNAKDDVSSISSTSSETSTITDTVQDIYNEVLSLANSTYGSGYIYSGNLSDTKPFSNDVEISGGAPADITFNLAANAADTTIEIKDSDGDVVRTLTVTSGSEGTNTITWDGLDDSGNTLADGNYTFTVSAADSSGSAVASYPSYRGDTGGKEFSIGKDSSFVLNNNGGDIFSSSLKALSQIITALGGSSTTTISTTDLSAALKEAMSQIKSQEVALSNATTLITNVTDRLDKLTTYINGQISDVETGNTTKAAAELTAQETAYETTESTLASILKMAKLSDYL